MDPLWWLVPAGFVAGFLDSIVGGGGIITLPALLATGMPAHAAVATNKIAGTGASSMASLQYARAGLISAHLWWSVPLAFGAAVLGASTLVFLPERLILGAVVVVVAAMVVYVLARPGFGMEPAHLPGRWRLAGLGLLALVVGFYDGILGPGTGTMLLFGIIWLTGAPFLQAAAHGRILNMASNLGALFLFLGTGLLDWHLGLPMMLATMAGAYVGSRTGIRKGAAWIRGIFVLVALALLVRIALAII